MPHLEKGVMSSLDDGRKAKEPGDLTYVLYKECCEYMVRNGRSFRFYCIVMGSLVCCALEFYRRKVAKYEDEKVAQNGEACGNLG